MAKIDDDIELRIVAFGREVKALRAAWGLTQARLAERAGLSVGAVSKVEQGYAAEMPTYQKIARVLDATLSLVRTPRSAPTVVAMDVVREMLALRRGGVVYRHCPGHSHCGVMLHPDNLQGLLAAGGSATSQGAVGGGALSEFVDRDLVLVGSPTAERLSRRLFNYDQDGDDVDSLCADNLPLDLPYRWLLSKNRIHAEATVRRFVRGHGVVERPNWRIEGPGRMYVPRVDTEGFLLDDYLLVTRLRNFASSRSIDRGHFVLSYGGTHGTATRALGLVMTNAALVSQLAAHLHRQPAAFQMLFHVSDIVHDPVEGSFGRRIRLLEDPVILPDTEAVWRSALQIVQRCA